MLYTRNGARDESDPDDAVKVVFTMPREPDVEWTAAAARELIGQRPRLRGFGDDERTGEVIAARLGDDGSVHVTLEVPDDLAGPLTEDRPLHVSQWTEATP